MSSDVQLSIIEVILRVKEGGENLMLRTEITVRRQEKIDEISVG